MCRLWLREERYSRIRLADGKQESLDDLDSIYNYADGLRQLVSGERHRKRSRRD